jgi:hypothetical protein
LINEWIARPEGPQLTTRIDVSLDLFRYRQRISMSGHGSR